MSKSLYYILSFTWGFIMTAIGCITALILMLLGHKPQVHKKAIFFTLKGSWGGIDLGPVFILDSYTTEYIKNHEYGHSIQNAMYGPFFIILVAIPSFIRCQLWDIINKDGTKDYYSIWFEKQASELGEQEN